MVFPSWTPTTITSGIHASTIVRELITNYIAIQTNLSKIRGALADYNSYNKTYYTSTGYVITGGLSHFYLSGVTASQHHNRLHGTSHVTATDPIPIASASANGLMSTSQYAKINTISTNASHNPLKVSKYIGNNRYVSKYISLGWLADSVKVLMGSNAHIMWELNRTHLKTHKHYHLGHSYYPLSSSLTIRATGFSAIGSCNITNLTYYFLALK